MTIKPTRGIPLREAFERVGVGPTKGYELVNAGKLRTYCVGRKRLASNVAIAECIERLESEEAATRKTPGKSEEMEEKRSADEALSA